MKQYKCLNQQVYESGIYKIVPIRDEDKLSIMKWRNEQIYHLRQESVLTEEKQNLYFEQVISKLFEEEKPSQILFSYLENDICIGYGGLVHINWIDQNAEISFIMDTSIEKDFFDFHWGTYLDIIEKVAFQQLTLHKLFIYAFDLRPQLYKAIELKQFKKEATLKEHCFFSNKFIDVIIHSKIVSL